MTITNKTLSPQYLLWMGGPMAALLAYRPQATPDERPAISRIAGQALILALLTQLVYPLFYDSYLGRDGHAMIIISTSSRPFATSLWWSSLSRSAGWPGACWALGSSRDPP